jgi:hypothetical protein
MATITTPSRSPERLAESQRKVRHPLERLRSTIRFYVSMEGATVLLLYLALWFWIGLALDYGFFKLFSVDWVQELPWGFRAGVLIVLLAGLLAVVAVKVLFRLLTDFRDSALALVLERRYPKLLGDRLITAVELADVRKSARYGYSREMVEQTIMDAADRVDRAPVNEVFNWRRLTTRGVLVGLLIVGLYLLAVVGFCAADAARTHRVSLAGLGQFHEVAGTWFERNVLLRDTLWPRRAFLEVIYPDREELRIGQDSPPPPIRARALKWIVADPKAPEKWRALTWHDLEERPELLGGAAPPALPESWQAQRDDWSVDQVELQLGKQDVDKLLAAKKTLNDLDKIANTADGSVRKNPPPEAGHAAEAKWLYSDAPAEAKWRPMTWGDVARALPGGAAAPALPADWFPAGTDPAVDQVEAKLAASQVEELGALKTEVLDRLNETNASGRYRRTLRKVAIPDTVYAISRGASSYNTITMQKTGDNEYAGALTDLKEDVRYTVRGEDYYTPYRRIKLVPPPGVSNLVRDEYQPAYLYYRTPTGGTAEDLKNGKQVFRNLVSSVAGSDTTRIQVPRGTDVVLTLTVDKELRRKDPEKQIKEDGVRILPPRQGVAEVKAPITLLDEHTFQTRFDNVHTPLDFVFEFTDTDNVVGLRHLVIRPLDDNPPEVDVQVDVIRKTKDGLMVTPFALVPFSGKVRDDHGLAAVNYVCTLTRLEGQGAETGGRAILLLGALYQLGGGPGQDLVTAMAAAALAKDAKPQTPETKDEGPEKLAVPAFVEALDQRAKAQVGPEVFDKERFLELLQHSPYDPLEVHDPNDNTKMLQLRHPLALPRANATDPITLRTLFSEFTFEPDKAVCNFDMLKLARGPKIAGDREIQPRYRMQVWVEGTDNDVLTGPHTSQSKEKFSFIVVGVNELLSEIAKEEEGLHLKLDDTVNRLKESRARLDQVIGDLGTTGFKADQFSPLSVRSEEVEQVREKSEQASQEVLNDYQKILKEMEVNRVQRVQPGIVTKVERTIATPLDDVLHAEFPRAKEGLDELRKTLDDKDMDLQAKVEAARKSSLEARARLEVLIQKLNAVLDAMGTLEGINDLVKKLRQLEEDERTQYEVIDRLRNEVLKDLANDLFGPDKPKEKK